MMYNVCFTYSAHFTHASSNSLHLASLAVARSLACGRKHT